MKCLIMKLYNYYMGIFWCIQEKLNQLALAGLKSLIWLASNIPCIHVLYKQLVGTNIYNIYYTIIIMLIMVMWSLVATMIYLYMLFLLWSEMLMLANWLFSLKDTFLSNVHILSLMVCKEGKISIEPHTTDMYGVRCSKSVSLILNAK